MVWQQLELSLFNIVCASTSGFCILFCVFSEFLKERLYISEPVPATLFGFIFNKARWVVPDNYGSVDAITRDMCRLVLGIQLMLAGVQLPAKYLWKAWVSMTMLLVPVMTVMWVVSALVIYLAMPNLSYLEALIIGSCITPTDPVLSGSLVKGSFSDRFVHHGLRDLILAESGANDGFGYPFLFFALFIYRFKGVSIAQHWLLYTVVYEILLSVVYGSLIGFLAQYLVVRAYEKNLADRESYYFSVFAISLFIVGTAGLIGTDDLLACFFAGNTFTWNGSPDYEKLVIYVTLFKNLSLINSDKFRVHTEKDTVQPVFDLMLNLAIFIWVGATVPWGLFNSICSVWHFVVAGICIMLFRRLPVILALYKIIPEIKGVKEAAFTGFFGPIGIGALFYLQVALEQLAEWGLDTNQDYLCLMLRSVVYFSILTSIIVHGVGIPILRLAILVKTSMKKRRNGKLSRSASEPSQAYATSISSDKCI